MTAIDRRSITLAVALVGLTLLAPGPARSEGQTIHQRMFHHRAVDAVVWAMPLLNFKQYREGHRAIGVGYNDVAYYSKLQDWKFQTATPTTRRPM